ncbi:hypothetical protein M8A51_01890 [Schlegelella sp. S2-27]|uniref:Uncharacterized protein n=1 Tax=Caldimonas mangrovi TaxID=2944811 RepID=A0ABT0YHR5_9BURK|nr:hypothetical protein [Caldimonas mangrovi]MCM5678275.1 hypothetical protein [Caldimonas mangrovi]
MRLRREPDWRAAAQSLVDGCASLDGVEPRVQLVERVCVRLGDELYPAFLKVMCLVGACGDAQARRLVAGALAHAVATGRLPSGRLAAWGSSGGLEQAPRTAGLGPIEFLCAWYERPAGPQLLSAAAFERAAGPLIELVSTDDTARSLYCAKLQADAEDPLIGGAWSRSGRTALAALARSWRAGEPATQVIERYLDAFNGPGAWPPAAPARFG